MLRRLRNKKAQNTAEYAILIGIVVAAAVAMQTYVKRGLQARIKDEVDEISPIPFEPDYISSTFSPTRNGSVTTDVVKTGIVTRTYDETSNRTGNQDIYSPTEYGPSAPPPLPSGGPSGAPNEENPPGTP